MQRLEAAVRQNTVVECVGMSHLYSNVSGVDINDHKGTAGGPFQAGQLSTYKADNLVQLRSALLSILG